MLELPGYVEIGMDHPPLPEDSLNRALQNGTLHRNFMGYSSSFTQVMIGLGVSSISDAWYAFAQNEKSVEIYTQKVMQEQELPVVKGHLLNTEDLAVRQHILNIMCRMNSTWSNNGMQLPEIKAIRRRLQEMQRDGLLILHEDGLTVTEKGRPFVRNIAMAFDLRLLRNQPDTRIFSMTV
ncbi:oxygen-independent coproporphyrinogen III oxidase [Niabella ginsenosidivorans]|uniref:hypothetical protein n=1 Tax=Niabella ginsenosidivorans TaxID=1176587 RepID=UPI001FE1AC25|nr:hypothetical protein [Niabella ginsenosidivorans]